MKSTSIETTPRAEGEKQRQVLPRTDLAKWNQNKRKRTPAELLDESAHDRVPSLMKVKKERMACSPFAFFRGAVPVMAYDLSLYPHTGIETQLCGDAHVQNLGAYEGPDGRLIFDINDFDETIRGPFEWDVKRMATSILLAGNVAKIKAAGCAEAVELFLAAYCGLMNRLAKLPVLDVARWQVHRLGQIAPVSKILHKAERATPLHSLESLTEQTPKGRVFKSDPPLLRPLSVDEERPVLASLSAYHESLSPERRHFFAQFRVLASAFKVVGTGSVGLRDYCVLMQGNGVEDPLFLQIKQESVSAWAPYLKQAKRYTNEGLRTVEGQARDAAAIRPHAGLDGDRRARLPGAPVERPQSVDRHDRAACDGAVRVCAGVRRNSGAGSRAIRQCAGDLGVYGEWDAIQAGDSRLCGTLRRADGHGLEGFCGWGVFEMRTPAIRSRSIPSHPNALR